MVKNIVIPPVIIIDKQEKTPLVFPSREVTIAHESLDTGDYAIRTAPNKPLSPIRIERKSIADLFSSFTGDNYRRERNKITRAKDAGLRYIIAIEGTVSTIRKGYSYTKGGRRHTSGKDGLSQVRQLMRIAQKYNIEIVYCDGRDDMAFFVQECLLTYWRHDD